MRVGQTFLRFFIAAAAIAVTLVTYAAAQSTNEAQRKIREALENWMTEFNAGNTRAVCDLFAYDLISDYHGQPERNYDALCALLRKSLNDEQRKYRYSLEVKEILVSGDLAAVRLVWTLHVKQRNQQGTDSVVEPGLDIFRRQPDGTWKIWRFIAYAASP